MSKFPPLPACQGKVEYRSRTEALGAAARYVGRHNTSKLRVYVCHFCHRWHLTNQVRSKVAPGEFA